MTHSSKAVANYFLDLGDRNNIEISPMKIQKLVYYAHGWNLGFTGEPLINEQVECWRYGPVIDTLFHAFKQYGSNRITDLARSNRRESLEAFIPRVDEDDLPATTMISAVWKGYGKISAIKLSNMTHEAGGPWHRVYTENERNPMKGTDIPLEYIRDYFKKLVTA